jgi:hypothetical protein
MPVRSIALEAETFAGAIPPRPKALALLKVAESHGADVWSVTKGVCPRGESPGCDAPRIVSIASAAARGLAGANAHPAAASVCKLKSDDKRMTIRKT